MIYALDPAELRLRAGSLRRHADDLGRTTSDLLEVLALVGVTSPSTRALSTTVSELRDRATDLDARAAFVEHLDPIAAVVTVPSFDPRRFDTLAGDDLSDMAALSADLDRRIANWSGSDNDPILDDMIAARDELASRLTTSSASSVEALQDRLAELRSLARYVNVGSSIEGTLEDLAIALREVGFDPTTFQRALDAMTSGLSPREAGLPSHYFTADYRAAWESSPIAALTVRLARVDVEIGDLRSELEAQADLPWWQSNDTYIRLVELAGERADLIRWVEEVRAALPRPDHRLLIDRLYTFDLPAETRDASIGILLADLYGMASAELDAGLLGLLADQMEHFSGQPTVAVSFFNALGPDGLAGLPDTYMRAFDGYVPLSDYAWANHLDGFGNALAAATQAPGLTIRPADLADWRSGRMDASVLLNWGRYDTEFLIEYMAQVVVAMADPGAGPSLDAWYDVTVDRGTVEDLRVYGLRALAAAGPDAVVDFVDHMRALDTSDLPWIDDGWSMLMEPIWSYGDDGDAMAAALGTLGSQPDDPNAVALAALALTTITGLDRNQLSYHPGYLLALPLMMEGHLASLLTLEGGRGASSELSPSLLAAHLEPAQLANVLEYINRDRDVADLFLMMVGAFRYQAIQGQVTPDGADTRLNYELGTIEGITVDAYLTNSYIDGRERDAAIALAKGVFAAVVGLATGGIGTMVITKLGLTGAARLGAKALNSFLWGQIRNKAVGSVLPSDNAEQALVEGYLVLNALAYETQLAALDALRREGLLDSEPPFVNDLGGLRPPANHTERCDWDEWINTVRVETSDGSVSAMEGWLEPLLGIPGFSLEELDFEPYEYCK